MTDSIAGPPDFGALWADASLAAALFAVDPHGLGVRLRARAGPTRERWLGAARSLLPVDMPLRRVPLGISDDRLIGGLDMAATLAANRPVVGAGVLSEADGGVVILAMTDAMDRHVAARIAAAFDEREVRIEREGFSQIAPSRFGILALDEGVEPDERTPELIADRLAFHLELDDIPFGAAVDPVPASLDDIARARVYLPSVLVPDEVVRSLSDTAIALGILSLRAPMLAVRAAAAHAALHGNTAVDEDDAAAAARLVLAPRATMLPANDAPAPQDEQPPPEQRPDDAPDDAQDQPDVQQMEDIVLAAARAAIPPGLLSRLLVERAGLGRARETGRSGTARKSIMRGRPAGVRQGRPHAGARLHLIETLRAAAPWQKLRRNAMPDAPNDLLVRVEDFRLRRHVERAQTTTIFVLDASGSSALNRLAEAKGAIELLLADCYVRRDRVAVIAFRSRSADLLLPPTRSLTRAKRCLAAMPGGGGTPLASGLNAAAELALSVRRRGGTASIVVLTDGRANIALDGSPGRAKANEDATAQAKLLRAHNFACALIDTSPQPQPGARSLAVDMGAVYLPLPHADAEQMSGVVRTMTRQSQAARARAS
ncbi:MAG: magnesium chelatase subunit D [Beijerinckiaceae bacterium]